MPTAVPPEEYTRYIKYIYNEKHVNLSLNLFIKYSILFGKHDLLYNRFFCMVLALVYFSNLIVAC